MVHYFHLSPKGFNDFSVIYRNDCAAFSIGKISWLLAVGCPILVKVRLINDIIQVLVIIYKSSYHKIKSLLLYDYYGLNHA